MPSHVSESIYQALADIRLVDPHSHINPLDPASHTLADLLGYHYYTELAHSSGMPKAHIEQRELHPKELVSRLVAGLPAIENTAQYRWLIELCRTFFGFTDDRITATNWEDLYDAAETRMQAADWSHSVLAQSNVEAVFLTNYFDDKLVGFDTDVYIPCLRTDELVFHLHKRSVQQRLEESTGISLDGSLASLRNALRSRFEHFISRGARACAISLPPSFTPGRVSDGRAASALDDVLRRTDQADVANRDALSRRVFWTLAELCDDFGLPFDLMIGVNRGVYADGVYQGQDLYDSRVSLIQYRELFNAFPGVKFPISVLASVTNQELVSYAWIFPNVITNGHWWYSNTPSFIARDAAVRLEAVPQTKQIAYYSDAYKLEFIWPKFDMYRRILAELLTDQFVRRNGWSEERAIDLGRKILRDNVDEIFPRPDTSKIHGAESRDSSDTPDHSTSTIVDAAGVAAAGLAAVAASDPLVNDDVQEVELADDVDEIASTGFDENATLGDSSMQPPARAIEDWDDPALDEDAFELDRTIDESGAFETVVEHDHDSGSGFDEPTLNENESEAASWQSSNEFPSSIETIEESINDETLPSDASYFDDATGIEKSGTGEPVAWDDLGETLDLDLAGKDSGDDAGDGDRGDIGAQPASNFETIDAGGVESGNDENLWPLDAPDDVPERAEPTNGPELPELSDLPDLVESPEPFDLDAVPNDDEIRSLPVDDVELRDYAAELIGLDAEKLEREIESEPLDVGDLWGDDTDSGAPDEMSSDDHEPRESEVPQIRMLRGEESFSPDEESLQMSSNPATGELVFPVDDDNAPASNDADDDSVTTRAVDDEDEWLSTLGDLELDDKSQPESEEDPRP